MIPRADDEPTSVAHGPRLQFHPGIPKIPTSQLLRAAVMCCIRLHAEAERYESVASDYGQSRSHRLAAPRASPMMRRLTFTTVKGAGIVLAILTASMANAQQASSRQWLSQPQQSSLRPVRPIVHDFHLQPNRSELQHLGVPAPSRQQIQQIDRLMRQLLEDSKSTLGDGGRP